MLIVVIVRMNVFLRIKGYIWIFRVGKVREVINRVYRVRMTYSVMRIPITALAEISVAVIMPRFFLSKSLIDGKTVSSTTTVSLSPSSFLPASPTLILPFPSSFLLPSSPSLPSLTRSTPAPR